METGLDGNPSAGSTKSTYHFGMTAREVFRLAIKIVGFVLILKGLWSFLEGLMMLFGFATATLSTPRYWIAWGVIKSIAGIYLMIGQHPFVDFALPERSGDSTGSAAATASSERIETKERAKPPADFNTWKMLFDVVVKTVGLIVLLYGAEYLLEQIMYSMQSSESSNPSNKLWIVFSVLEIVAGLLLMRGVVPVADFAFPEETASTDASTDEPTTSENQPDDKNA